MKINVIPGIVVEGIPDGEKGQRRELISQALTLLERLPVVGMISRVVDAPLGSMEFSLTKVVCGKTDELQEIEVAAVNPDARSWYITTTYSTAQVTFVDFGVYEGVMSTKVVFENVEIKFVM